MRRAGGSPCARDMPLPPARLPFPPGDIQVTTKSYGYKAQLKWWAAGGPGGAQAPPATAASSGYRGGAGGRATFGRKSTLGRFSFLKHTIDVNTVVAFAAVVAVFGIGWRIGRWVRATAVIIFHIFFIRVYR